MVLHSWETTHIVCNDVLRCGGVSVHSHPVCLNTLSSQLTHEHITAHVNTINEQFLKVFKTRPSVTTRSCFHGSQGHITRSCEKQRGLFLICVEDDSNSSSSNTFKWR